MIHIGHDFLAEEEPHCDEVPIKMRLRHIGFDILDSLLKNRKLSYPAVLSASFGVKYDHKCSDHYHIIRVLLGPVPPRVEKGN